MQWNENIFFLWNVLSSEYATRVREHIPPRMGGASTGTPQVGGGPPPTPLPPETRFLHTPPLVGCAKWVAEMGGAYQISCNIKHKKKFINITWNKKKVYVNKKKNL